MTALPTLAGGSSSYAYGINASGQVVGWSYTFSDQHAFLYTNGAMTDLGTLGGTSSAAHGINASGQVVGEATTTPMQFLYHAFLYSNGTMTDLGTLGGNVSHAYGINASGQVAGNSYTPSAQIHAFLYCFASVESGRLLRSG
jgi:probable HAF family extracellular repeat protein